MTLPHGYDVALTDSALVTVAPSRSRPTPLRRIGNDGRVEHLTNDNWARPVVIPTEDRFEPRQAPSWSTHAAGGRGTAIATIRAVPQFRSHDRGVRS